jgi:hypothetical protein
VLGDADIERVRAVTVPLGQGDLISTSHFVSLGAHESTFHPDTAECDPLPGQEAWVAVGREIATRWGVVITQTCDLIRPPDEEAWIQVAPLVDLGSVDQWERACQGRDLDYFALPKASDVEIRHGAVNGQLSFPVEKAALLHDDIKVSQTPLDPAERIWLSMWLARRCGRHAFPDLTEDLVLRPLRSEIARRWSKPNTQVGAFVHSLLGVWASAYEAPVVDIYFIMDPSKLAANISALSDGAVIDRQADVLMRASQKRIAASGRGLQVTCQAATLDSVPADKLLMRMRQVDLELLPAGAHTATAEAAAQSS